MDDLLADFVAETREMLEASEGELIAWEKNPGDRTHLDAIFRFFHTVKGNCGFFDFPRLEKLSHAAEDVLAAVRSGQRNPDAALVTAILAIIDRIGELNDAIEAGAEFPVDDDHRLIAALGEDEIEIIAENTAPAHEPENGPRASDVAVAMRSIRLPVELLDRVMSGVSDMVLARNDLAHRLNQAGTQPTIDGPFERLSTILTDVRDAITRMRMQRIETLFNAFPRLVRDLSAELGKQVMIDLEGGDVELDREMIEMIRDPMTHIIRNAIDHGIEKPTDRLKAGKHEIGMLSITARQSGNKISIVVSDDGHGLDENRIAAKAVANGLISAEQRASLSREEILQLVFTPGLSTAEQVTSVSGRGVGLDVVRENLEKVGGSIRVTSTAGTGSLFFLTIPLTLSIITGLSIETGGQRFAMPQSYVEEIVPMGADTVDYSRVGDSALVTFRGQRIRCLSLAEILGVEHNVAEQDRSLLMLRMASGDIFALSVDQIHNIADMVVKPLPAAIMDTQLYGGSTLMDNGVPVLLLDIPTIAINAGLVSETRAPVARPTGEAEAKRKAVGMHAVLFTGHDGRHLGVRMELVQRIETIGFSAIEPAGGSLRCAIDGDILPLVGMTAQDLEQAKIDQEKTRLLRLSDGVNELLYAVREVRDATLITGNLTPVDGDEFIQGVTLVDDRMVHILDGHALFSKFGAIPKPARSWTCQIPDNEWARNILEPLIESAGYELAPMDAEHADIVIAMDDEAVSPLPHVITLRSRPDAEYDDEMRSASIYRYDRDGLLSAMHRIRKEASR